MIEALTVTNYRGDSLEMILADPWSSGLCISKIDGISPGDAEINSTDYGVLDGGVFNSARIGTRNITIEFYYLFYPDIETSRHIAYKYFPVKTKVDLAFRTDHRTIVASGYVEANDTMIFSKQESGQVSIICPDPYFYSEFQQTNKLSGVLGGFSFPFYNDGLDEKTIEFGIYSDTTEQIINYEGDIATGFVMRIRFLSDRVGTVQLYETRSNTFMSFSIPEIESSYGLEIQRDDAIVVSSVKGNRYVYFEGHGLSVNLLGYFYEKMSWFELHPGENRYVLKSGSNLEDIEIIFEYRSIYGGV